MLPLWQQGSFRFGGRAACMAAGSLPVWRQGRFWYDGKAISVMAAAPLLIWRQNCFRYGRRAASVMVAGLAVMAIQTLGGIVPPYAEARTRGSYTPKIQELVFHIDDCCINANNQHTLWAPPKQTIIADYMSKLGSGDACLFSILPWIRAMLERTFGTHTTDRFASHNNVQSARHSSYSSLGICPILAFRHISSSNSSTTNSSMEDQSTCLHSRGYYSGTWNCFRNTLLPFRSQLSHTWTSFFTSYILTIHFKGKTH
jgi:hypothetical protein